MNFCRATSHEKSMRLPGDNFVELARVMTTHAITICRSPRDVWPWIVQIGQNRAGFYSYSILENLIGCQINNSERIVAEWQTLSCGDTVRIHPKAKPLVVEDIENHRYLVLVQNSFLDWSWSFNLEPVNRDGCEHARLIVRTRGGWNANSFRGVLKTMFLIPGFHLGHYFMERGMLLGIAKRCENVPRQ